MASVVRFHLSRIQEAFVMLRHLVLTTAGLIVAGSVASAQIDYTDPNIKIEVTAAQIQAFTNQTEKVDLAALGIDSAGRLYTYTANKRSGLDGAVSQSNDPELVRIDVSGGAPVFTTIASYLQLQAIFNLGDGAPENAMYFNAIEVGPGTIPIIYVSQTRGTDDVVAINPGAAPPATTTLVKMRQGNGVSSMVLNNAQSDLVLTVLNDAGAPSNGIFTIPANNVGPWPSSLLLDQLTVTTHTGAVESGIAAGVQMATNQYLFWDELSFGGSDRLLRFTPGAITPVEKALALNEVGADPTGEGLTAITRGGNDTVFAWSEFPTSAPVQASEGLYLWQDPIKPLQRITVHDTTINAATGLVGNREVAIGGIKVRNLVETNEQVVYIADTGTGAAGPDNILSIRYSPGIPTLNGDVNDDGFVNVIDVTELNLFLDAIIPAPGGDADADNDGDIDLDDEQDIIDFIVNGVALPF